MTTPNQVLCAGFWPAHGDAVLDEHLAEDWLGIAQGP